MKEHGIKVLYGVLGIGILITIFHIINTEGGSGLENAIITLSITSLILFIFTSIYIFTSFKQNIKKISVWIFLILSFPVAIMFISNIVNKFYLTMVETTTPNEYIYNVKVDKFKYENDKIKLERLVDSLISIKTIEKPAEFALRSFNGKNYNDTIERNWAINLPLKLEYKESIIDTLFYSENGKDVVAGLLINEVFNKLKNYPNGAIDYTGYGFAFNNDSLIPFKILRYSIGGYDTYKSCSKELRYYYLKKIGTYENEYNMNDKRFLN
ncbi:MAG: hypothetical protein QM478_12395 [Flavobacteriaceae bacterium]